MRKSPEVETTALSSTGRRGTRDWGSCGSCFRRLIPLTLGRVGDQAGVIEHLPAIMQEANRFGGLQIAPPRHQCVRKRFTYSGFPGWRSSATWAVTPHSRLPSHVDQSAIARSLPPNTARSLVPHTLLTLSGYSRISIESLP